MSIDTPEDLEGLRKIGKIVADCLREMQRAAEPGMTTAELDAIGRQFLDDHGARSAPELTYDFPGATCISVGHAAAHGIPDGTKIEQGMLMNIDVSAELDGYFGDTGGSFVVGEASSKQRRLLQATLKARKQGIAAAIAGRPLNGIGRAIEKVAKQKGYTVIRNLGSHGVGRALHEEPKFIASFDNPRERRRLEEGMVITIEPFLSTGAQMVQDGGDGWTLLTPDHWTAQFEHTIVITKNEPIVLTA